MHVLDVRMQLDITGFNKTIGAFHQGGNHWVLLVSWHVIYIAIAKINIAVANMHA